MKNKLTLLFLALLFSGIQFAFSQAVAVGSSDYGRIFDITYDATVENKLYATSLYNHILVSHDNGENWEVLYSMSVHDVTKFMELRLANNNTALSFIKYNQGSGDNTLMILDLNTNTIINEIEIPFASSDKYIQSYSISPQDSNVILMSTRIDFGTIHNTYYTTDGGQNWDLVYTKSANDEVAINNVIIDPNDTEHLFLSRGLGPNGVDGGLFISTDGGQSWTEKLVGVPVDPVVFSPQNNDVIYVGSGISFGSADENLYRSVDGGENWQAVPITWTSEQLDNITHIAFNPANNNHIIVLEENEIVISFDNGISWSNYIYDTSNVHSYYYGTNLSFNPFDQNEVFINSDYHPLFSEDGGTTVTWSKNNFYLSTGSIVYDPNGEEHLYYGVQYGYVHRNLSTGDEDNFDILPLGWFTQSDAPRLFADKMISGRVYFFSKGWFGSNLEVSVDHGQTKFPMFSTFMNSVDAVATDPFDPSVVWSSLSNFGGSSELKKSDVSDLNNVNTTTISLPESGIINGIHFDSLNPGHVLITLGTKVYKTTDYGVTWELSNQGLELMDPNNDLIMSLDANPFNSDQLTIASNRGIFTSLDRGDTWAQLSSDIVHQVYHSTATDGHMVGMVHTSQVSDFELVFSKDAGQTWERIENQELFQIGGSASVVIFSDNSAEVYMGSIDLGLLKYTIDLEVLGTELPVITERMVKVFPNPTANVVTVNMGAEQPESITVLDVTGQQLIEVFNTSEVDLSELASGVYFLNIKTDTAQPIVKRVIKN
ncbi:MAG: T9SS C-terminal target domain-containing protein [Flavobacterium sp.]|nr:MAG: T9SS C-terminal target domain-containing protein [Flavobacterium sp.]